MIRHCRGILTGSVALALLVTVLADGASAAGGGGAAGATGASGAGGSTSTGSNAGPGAPGSTGGTTSSIPSSGKSGTPSVGAGSPNVPAGTQAPGAPTSAQPNNPPAGTANQGGVASGMGPTSTIASTPGPFGAPTNDSRGEPEKDGITPAGSSLPANLSLEDAMRIFRSKGLDLLIADANIRGAEGAERAAGAVLNPIANLSYGRLLGYNSANACPPNGSGCSANAWSVGLSDNAAIEDSLSGKRELRESVAHAALKAARMVRSDAERTIAFQVKAAYFQVVLATQQLNFAADVAKGSRETYDLTKTKYDKGAINAGDAAIIETAALEADQAFETAKLNLRQARVALGFLLGTRGHVPDFNIVPPSQDANAPTLENVSQGTLVNEAFAHRPDLAAYMFQKERAEASIRLAKRNVIPDISISGQYTQTGTADNSVQPPTLTFGVTSGLPIFYQQQGEIRQAEADSDTQSLERAKVEAQVVSDVESAYASYVTSRALVDRMKGVGGRHGLYDTAKTARDIVKKQFDAGAISTLPYLDAQRTFITTTLEYLTDLTNYWTAIAQLEQATGTEFRK